MVVLVEEKVEVVVGAAVEGRVGLGVVEMRLEVVMEVVVEVVVMVKERVVGVVGVVEVVVQVVSEVWMEVTLVERWNIQRFGLKIEVISMIEHFQVVTMLNDLHFILFFLLSASLVFLPFHQHLSRQNCIPSRSNKPFGISTISYIKKVS